MGLSKQDRALIADALDIINPDDAEQEKRARQLAHMFRMPALHIEGRRWFQRGPGNTYHSVRIYSDGELIAHLPYSYGYGEQWLQTAVDWLRANGYPSAEYGTRYLREELGGTYTVLDVDRKKYL